MAAFFCISIVVILIFIFAWGIYYEGRHHDNYKGGQHNFSPDGVFIVAGRLKTNGVWMEIKRFENPCKTTKVGRTYYHHYDYENELRWIELAVELAREVPADSYQDIRVSYWQCQYTQLDEMVRSQTIWLNGKWV
jgi:hypothetical protein